MKIKHDLEYITDAGYTIIHYACYSNYIQLLIKYSVALECCCRHYYTIYHLVHDKATIKLLIDDALKTLFSLAIESFASCLIIFFSISSNSCISCDNFFDIVNNTI